MNLEQLILNCFEDLSETDWEVWDYVWKNREACERMSITQIAEGAGVSPGAITRLMKKLGLNGFTEFKLALRWQNKEKDYLPLGLQSRLTYSYTETMKILERTDFSPMFELLDKSKRIFVYGTGAVQKNAAEEFKRVFMYMGRREVYVIESEAEFKQLEKLAQPGDLLTVISMSGQNAQANGYAAMLKDKGVSVMSITNGSDNTLADMSEFNFPFECHYIIKRPGDLGDHHTTSIFFYVVEAMFLEYLQYLHLTDAI